MNIFGEMFSAPPETQYEYVVATVDVKEQKLKLFLDMIQVEEYSINCDELIDSYHDIAVSDFSSPRCPEHCHPSLENSKSKDPEAALCLPVGDPDFHYGLL